MIDMVTAAITVALRRADEMGDAIAARGGVDRFRRRRRGRSGVTQWRL